MRSIYNFFCTYQAIFHCLQLFFKQTFPCSQGGVSDKFKCNSAFRLYIFSDYDIIEHYFRTSTVIGWISNRVCHLLLNSILTFDERTKIMQKLLYFLLKHNACNKTYFTEVESRTQGSRPRPRTQKNPRPRPRTAFPRTDTLEAKDRNARGQGQGPRTQSASALQKKK